MSLQRPFLSNASKKVFNLMIPCSARNLQNWSSSSAVVRYQTHRLAREPFLPWVRVPQLDHKGEQAGVHLGQVEPGKTK